MRFRLITATALTAVALTAGPALASTIDLAPPGKAPFFAANVGDSRSFVFTDDIGATLTSVGIRMDPLVSTFGLTAELYAYNLGASTRGALLVSGSGSFTDLGTSFYDVAIAFALAAGQSYELNIHPIGGFSLGLYNMEFYNFNNPGADVAYAAGPITVIDGAGDGSVGGRPNSVISHFHIDANTGAAAPVPEPTSLLLLGSGLAVGLRAFRNRVARR